MTALILSNYISLGEQTTSDTFVDSAGNSSGVAGALSMEESADISATYSGLVSPEGELFEVKVIYADQTNPLLVPVWEVMEASYELDAGVYKWVRNRTIASSNAGAAVTFTAATGTPNLIFFGVNSHEQFGLNLLTTDVLDEDGHG